MDEDTINGNEVMVVVIAVGFVLFVVVAVFASLLS